MFVSCERAAPLIFDTDVLIWFLRGNDKAARAIEADSERAISIISLMELDQGARSKREISFLRAFFPKNSFRIEPITETISHLAATLMEEYSIRHGLQVADALIAATARATVSTLLTGNVRHFRPIPSLELRQFRAT